MSLTVITGPMYAGKSTQLILQLERYELAGKKVCLYKTLLPGSPQPKNKIVTHWQLEKEATFLQPTRAEVQRMVREVLEKELYAVGIDEGHFFQPESGIIEGLNYLADKGVHVFFAALNMDFKGESFPIMRELLPIADEVIYLKAVCTYKLKNGKTCGRPATRTQRLIDGKPAPYDSPVYLPRGKVEGKVVTYEARCREHHFVPKKPNFELV